ncbi:hypothetical protein J6590_056693 [Homalodisca vitripennis]|nr:hypothetical protein J6590_056693 [Homalodisca vitripennis]
MVKMDTRKRIVKLVIHETPVVQLFTRTPTPMTDQVLVRFVAIGGPSTHHACGRSQITRTTLPHYLDADGRTASTT